jgi:glycosyltransferase involved in cell wall biosynthesis
MPAAVPHDPQDLRISVVIPARNEAENLFHVLPYLANLIGEVILVDGRSTDDTAEVASLVLPSIRIIHQTSRGKGDALRLGFAACTGDIIVMLDADGSTDPRELPRFVEALRNGADFAKGSRFLPGGSSSDITLFRRMGVIFLNGVVNLCFQAKFTDFAYGYNAFWRRCLPQLEIDVEGFEIDAMLTVRALRAGLRVQEVPSNERNRIHGRSNLNSIRDGWAILRMTLREWRRNKQRRVSADSPAYHAHA